MHETWTPLSLNINHQIFQVCCGVETLLSNAMCFHDAHPGLKSKVNQPKTLPNPRFHKSHCELHVSHLLSAHSMERKACSTFCSRWRRSSWWERESCPHEAVTGCYSTQCVIMLHSVYVNKRRAQSMMTWGCVWQYFALVRTEWSLHCHAPKYQLAVEKQSLAPVGRNAHIMSCSWPRGHGMDLLSTKGSCWILRVIQNSAWLEVSKYKLLHLKPESLRVPRQSLILVFLRFQMYYSILTATCSQCVETSHFAGLCGWIWLPDLTGQVKINATAWIFPALTKSIIQGLELQSTW